MATSGYKDIAVTSYDTLRFSWWQLSQSIEDNSTEIEWGLYLIATKGGAISSSADKSWWVNVDGSYYEGTNKIGISNNDTISLAHGTTTISHNVDGSKEFSFSFAQYFGITFSGKQIGSISGSGTDTLDSIPRQATITAAPHFTDEDNPTITYSNPAGNAVSSLQACIASADGHTVYVPYRDISKTDSSYTFNLTEEERESLRWATINSNTLSVKFYVTTVIGSNYYYSTLEKILTIANANPTLTAEVTADADTIALTGNNDTLIRYKSNVTANASYTALKGASIKSYAVSCGNNSLSTVPAIFEAVESSLFTFAVTDSRGNTNTKTVTKNLVEYVKLTCDTDINIALTSEELATITIKIYGNYFNNTFGAITNEIALAYRYKTESGDYGEWVHPTAAFTPTFSGNTYELTVTIENLDYRNAYTIQCAASDKVAYIESVEKTIKAIPVFDWGKDDFNFNVPVTIQGIKAIRLGTVNVLSTPLTSSNTTIIDNELTKARHALAYWTDNINGYRYLQSAIVPLNSGWLVCQGDNGNGYIKVDNNTMEVSTISSANFGVTSYALIY